VKNIIETNRWQRPVYFAITCPPDSRIGIDDYLRFCGLAWKLVPYKAIRVSMGIDPGVLGANLFNEPAEFSRTPRYGYKFRTTADTTVVLDENEVRMVSGLRSAFRALAIYEEDGLHDPAKSARVMDRMEQVIPWKTVPMLFEEGYDFALLYYRLGRPDKVALLTGELEREFRAETAAGPPANPYVYGQMIRLYELGGQYEAELALLRDIAKLHPDDPTVQARIDTVRAILARRGQPPGDSMHGGK